MIPFPSPCQSMTGFFSDIYYGDLAELLEVNLTVQWGPHETGSPWHFSLSDFSTWSLLQFISYSSGFSTPELVPAEISTFESALEKPWYPVFVSLLWEAGVCPVFSPFSQIQKELLIFQLCLFVVRLVWWLPSFLHVEWEGNQKSLSIIFLINWWRKDRGAELFWGSNKQ